MAEFDQRIRDLIGDYGAGPISADEKGFHQFVMNLERDYQKHKLATKKCISYLGHIVANIPGCNQTERQAENWKKFNDEFKQF